MRIFILSIILVLLSAFMEKTKPDLRIIVISFIQGKIINFFYYTVFASLDASIALRVVLILGGILAIGTGCAIMFCTKYPKNHIETFVFVFIEKYGMSYKKAKTLTEVGVFAIAIVLGVIVSNFSNIGIGSILSTFLLGPVLGFVQPTVNSVYDKVQVKELEEAQA